MADRPSPEVQQAQTPPGSRSASGTVGTVGRNGSRLSLALLGYVLGVVVLINLAPFDFTWPIAGGVPLKESPFDVLGNLLIFVPAGFLFRLTRGRGGWPAALDVLVLALAASTLIEAVQALEPYRTSSVLEAVAEGAGAWFGALLFDELSRRLNLIPGTMGRLVLEPPLMGLVYLLVPLLWLSSLGAGSGFDRPLITILLGLCGGSLLADVYRYQLGPAGVLSSAGLAGTAASWYLVGAVPGSALHPWQTLAGAAAVAGFAWLRCRRPVVVGERRFEIAALRRVIPLFTGYLVLIALWPMPSSPIGAWHGATGTGFPELSDITLEVTRLIEFCAAVTVAGYILAELRGREELPFSATAPRLLLAVGVLVGVLELVRGFHPEHSASLLRWALAVAAAGLGGLIYNLQRAHVRNLARSRASS